MTLRKGWYPALIAACLAVVAHSASIVERASAEPAELTATANLQAYRLALDLLDAGLARAEALTVIAAASIFARLQPADGSPRIAGAAPAQTPPSPTVDFAAMIAQARALAGEDGRLLGLIDDLNAGGSRGRQPTLARAVGHVSAGESSTYSIFYRGGEPAELMVRGDGSGELDLVVLDEYDREICRKSGRAELLCAWTPAWTAPVRVRIDNRGGAANQFHLLTN